jgi:hypothetical protein
MLHLRTCRGNGLLKESTFLAIYRDENFTYTFVSVSALVWSVNVPSTKYLYLLFIITLYLRYIFRGWLPLKALLS